MMLTDNLQHWRLSSSEMKILRPLVGQIQSWTWEEQLEDPAFVALQLVAPPSEIWPQVWQHSCLWKSHILWDACSSNQHRPLCHRWNKANLRWMLVPFHWQQRSFLGWARLIFACLEAGCHKSLHHFCSDSRLAFFSTTLRPCQHQTLSCLFTVSLLHGFSSCWPSHIFSLWSGLFRFHARASKELFSTLTPAETFGLVQSLLDLAFQALGQESVSGSLQRFPDQIKGSCQLRKQVKTCSFLPLKRTSVIETKELFTLSFVLQFLDFQQNSPRIVGIVRREGVDQTSRVFVGIARLVNGPKDEAWHGSRVQLIKRAQDFWLSLTWNCSVAQTVAKKDTLIHLCPFRGKCTRKWHLYIKSY